MATHSQVYDSLESSFVEIDNALNVVYAMPQATSFFRFFFPRHTDSARLPSPIGNWLEGEIANLNTYGSSNSVPATSSFDRCSRKLIVIAFIGIGMRVMTISLQEDFKALERYKAFVGRLTRRQQVVFQHLSEYGNDLKQIAQQLDISPRTAEEHRRIVLRTAKSMNMPLF